MKNEKTENETTDELIEKYGTLWSKWHSAKDDVEHYKKEMDILERIILDRIPEQIKINLKQYGKDEG